MSEFLIGDIEVTRIIDVEAPDFAPFEFFPDLTNDMLEPHLDWMQPRFLDPKSKKSFKEVLVKPALKIPRELILFTGPEGGWSDEELELFRLHEARVIHIGPRILRAETAVLAALSAVSYTHLTLPTILLV